MPQAINTATYNAANQQLTLGNQSLTYDLNGNLTTVTDPNGTTTYTWNARNQLAAIAGPGLTASFQYDAIGRRLTKTINSTTTEFLHDGLNAVQELSGGNVVANLLTSRGIDEVWRRTEATGSRSFLADGLGSTLALTDAMGTIQTEYTYEPFGNTTVNGASSTNPFQYTGRENDGTGLYYYRARYYNPTLQRFISEDPIGFAGGVNFCAYVGNDPLNFTDPEGLSPIGWVVKLCDKGLKKLRPLRSVAEARRARRQGENVLARNRQTAHGIEAGAFPNQPHLRHGGHSLTNSGQGHPHYQTPGRYGHTFWGSILGAIGGFLDPFGAISGELAPGDFPEGSPFEPSGCEDRCEGDPS